MSKDNNEITIAAFKPLKEVWIKGIKPAKVVVDSVKIELTSTEEPKITYGVIVQAKDFINAVEEEWGIRGVVYTLTPNSHEFKLQVPQSKVFETEELAAV